MEVWREIRVALHASCGFGRLPWLKDCQSFDLLDRRDCIGDGGGLVVNSRSRANSWQIVAEKMMRSESTGYAECVKQVNTSEDTVVAWEWGG